MSIAPLVVLLGLTASAACRERATLDIARIESECGCDGAPSHAAYVACARKAVRAAVKAGTALAGCRSGLLRCARRSTCGEQAAGAVICCRTGARGHARCRVERNTGSCGAPADARSCVGPRPSVCDASPVAGDAPPGPELSGRWALVGDVTGNSCRTDTRVPGFEDYFLTIEQRGVDLSARGARSYYGTVSASEFKLFMDGLPEYVGCSGGTFYDGFLSLAGALPAQEGRIPLRQWWGFLSPASLPWCPVCSVTWSGTMTKLPTLCRSRLLDAQR